MCGYAATVVKSSIVIRKATLFNVCMYAHTYMCVSLCMNVAVVMQHVSNVSHSMPHAKQLMCVSCKAQVFCCNKSYSVVFVHGALCQVHMIPEGTWVLKLGSWWSVWKPGNSYIVSLYL